MNAKTRAMIEAKAERQGVPGKCNMCFIEGAEAMEAIMIEREEKLVAERDAYALAMKVALEDGIFSDKSATKAKIEKLLQPFLAEHHAAKGEANG